MKTYISEELYEILTLHKQWLNSEENGKRADLRGADLRGADLRGADLRGADLRGANLWGADLSSANLWGADLSSANLSSADLRGADLRGADLLGADLSSANMLGADLRGADLRGADLRGAIGNLKHIKSLQCEKYYVTYTSTILQIACKNFTFEEWENFDDETISKMDEGALEWWTKWKPIIMQIIEMSPAEPTGDQNV